MAKVKILIVEDEFIIANETKLILEGMGYDVSSISASGEGAIEYAKKDKPDLVLMDIMLKGNLDGIEAAEKIRSSFQIPVIYLTAYANSETFERAKITTPFGYLIKPFKDRELHANIEMALYKHRAEKELKKILAEKEKLVIELKEALANVKTLRGMLPICAFCKKIRDNKGYWDQVESYIHNHSEADFTHTFCPECMKKYYPQIKIKKKRRTVLNH